MAGPDPEVIIEVYVVEEMSENYPLELVLNNLASMPLARRNWTMPSGASVRLEDIQPPSDDNDFWLLDFVHLRFKQGPGRASRKRPIVGFDMSNGDGFAHETAFFYKPAEKLLLAQYNHSGLKAAGASKYFAAFGPNNQAIGYEFSPVLADDVRAKLAKADVFRKVHVKLAPGMIDKSYRENGVSLDAALNLAEGLQAPFVEVTMSVGHAQPALKTQAVRKMISGLQHLIGKNPDAVKKAQIVGHDSDEPLAINEVMDLLTPRKRYSMPVWMDRGDLRYTRDSRYKALQKTYAALKNTRTRNR